MKITQISSNLGRAGDRTGDLVVGRQRSYQLEEVVFMMKKVMTMMMG